MPGAAERLELLIRRHQQRRRLVGPEHARRMRIEGHRRGRAAALAGAPPHAIDDLHVAAVQPVEVAEREHRLVPARRRVVRKVGGLQISSQVFELSAVSSPPASRSPPTRSTTR